MSKPISITENVSIHPTGATNTVNMSASSTYPAANAWTDSDSTTYARYTVTRSETGYTNYTFDISAIPAGATINSLTATVRVYINNSSYVSNTVCQFYTDTTAKGSNYTFNSTSNTNIVTMTNTGTWTYAELQNLRLRIGGTGANVSNSRYITVYGATVTINYTLSGTAYTINASSSINNITVDPLTQDVFNGQSGIITITTPVDTSFNITDNGTDILSQLIEGETGGELTIIPSGYTGLSSGVTINTSYPITRAYHDSSQTSEYARLDFSTSTTGYIELLFDFSEIPSNTTITSLTAKARLRISNTSRITNRICQLYADSTAKGSNVDFTSISSGGAVVTLTPGTWTRSELDTLKMRIGATSSSSTQSKYIYIYGADIAIEYAIAGKHYTYTISNISTDHTILIKPVGSSDKLLIKLNGSWQEVSKIYLKQNGSWIEQNLSYLSDNNITNLKQG